MFSARSEARPWVQKTPQDSEFRAVSLGPFPHRTRLSAAQYLNALGNYKGALTGVSPGGSTGATPWQDAVPESSVTPAIDINSQS